jgi:VIT1/CCC1 family predicted Fe2+/Mn2+ transporter
LSGDAAQPMHTSSCGCRSGATAVALISGAMVVGRLTGRPVLRSGLRQLLLGAVAVAITFGVGSLIGHHAG